MKNLTIKQIPTELYDALKKQAALHHRSLNKEAITCIEQGLEKTKPNREAILKRAEILRSKVKNYWLTQDELERIINRDRK